MKPTERVLLCLLFNSDKNFMSYLSKLFECLKKCEILRNHKEYSGINFIALLKARFSMKDTQKSLFFKKEIIIRRCQKIFLMSGMFILKIFCTMNDNSQEFALNFRFHVL